MAQKLKTLLAVLLLAVGLPSQASTSPSVLGYLAEQPAINQTRFIILFDTPIEGLEKDDFTIPSGCSFAYLEILDATAQLELADCPTGKVILTLRANSMGVAQLGPARDEKFEIEIDATAPSATFSDIQITGSGPYRYTTQLRFSEPVDFNSVSMVFASSGPCESTITAVSDGLNLQALCGYVELSWTLPARSLRDNFGNLGPDRDIKISLSNPAPAPPVTQTPTPVPTATSAPAPAPVETTPAPTPLPQSPSPMDLQIPAPIANLTSSDEVAVTDSEPIASAIETAMAISPTFITAPSPVIASTTAGTVLEVLQTQQPQEVRAEIAAPNQVTSDTPELRAEAIATVGVSRVKQTGPQESLGMWLIGAGSLSLIAMGLYRRFSGR